MGHGRRVSSDGLSLDQGVDDPFGHGRGHCERQRLPDVQPDDRERVDGPVDPGHDPDAGDVIVAVVIDVQDNLRSEHVTGLAPNTDSR
jgi:hypothetical protein